MSENIQWDIEGCIQVIESLNQYGTDIKSAIAGIYSTFRYRISNEWSGHNYNIVVREVNGCAPEFREMTTYLGVTVPTVLQEIVNMQAQNGQGSARTVALATDDENSEIWEVPESAETADGRTQINIEALRPYITGSTEPSVTAAIEQAKLYFQKYLIVFEQNISTFQNNAAVMEAYARVQDFQSQFESRTTELVEDIVNAAESGINKIAETDVSTRRAAQRATGGAEGISNSKENAGSSSGSSNHSTGNTSSSSSGYVSGGSSSNSANHSSGNSSSSSSGYVPGGSSNGDKNKSLEETNKEFEETGIVGGVKFKYVNGEVIWLDETGLEHRSTIEDEVQIDAKRRCLFRG